MTVAVTPRGYGAGVSAHVVSAREWLRALSVCGAILVDIAAIGLASVLATFLRFHHLAGGNTLELFLAVTPIYLLAVVACGGYRLPALGSWSRSAGCALIALTIAAALASAAAFALQVGAKLSRLETGFMLVGAAILLPIGRGLGALWLSRVRGVLEPNVVVLSDRTGERYEPLITHIDVRHRPWTPGSNDPAFLSDLWRSVQDADSVVLDFSDTEIRRGWAETMRMMGVHAETLEPQLSSLKPLGIGRWSNVPTIVVSRGPLSLPERVAKRLFDIGFTMAFSVVSVPLVAVLALLIRIESRGPAFFVQERVGRNNRSYRCYKLRTMANESRDATGTCSAARNDDRVTRLGRLLRKTSLDELPQLWNVFKGEMSLVGPRPHALGSTAEGALFWDAVEGYWSRHAMKPGLTGLAQVRGYRGATHTREDIRRRVASDLEYINGWSLWLDFKILLRTLAVIVHRNAF